MVFVSQNIKDIRAEPLSMPIFILQQAQEIGRSLRGIAVEQKLSRHALIGLRLDLWFLHCHTVLRADKDYYKKFEEKKREIDALLNSAIFWRDDDNQKDRCLHFLDLLMEWYQLEATTYERFNLLPAEDEELVMPEAPWVALGLVEP